MNEEDLARIREIVRQEVERGWLAFLDAKTTMAAIERGQFFSDGSLSHSKPRPRRQVSSPIPG